MMHKLEKSDPSTVAAKPGEQLRTIGSGVGGAKGRGQGKQRACKVVG